MITQREPRCCNKEPLRFGKIFSNSNNVVYLIQSDLQRRYCWPSTHVDKFYKDYIVDLYDKNKAANKNGEDSSYAYVGDAILTRKEEGYGHDGKCSKQEIIDMSQRITTVMAFTVCILYLFLNQNEQFDIKARRDLFDKYLKTKNGESYKVVSTFKDCNVDETINQLIENTFKYDKKDLKCFKESTTKKNETKYKPFSALCGYVLDLIDETLGKDNKDIRERLDMLLGYTFVLVEECDKSERVERFREVNTYRVGIADKDIYKGLLCAKGDSIDNKFQDFEAIVNEISNAPCKRINLLKTHITVTEYIMRLGIIMCDKTKNSCNFNYSLGDKDNGIEWHLNNENGLLNTEEKVLDYLDKCIDICNFLKESMNFNPTDFNCDWYLLAEGRNKPYIWLYNILPSYIISKITDKPKKDYAFECLLKSYLTYSIKYSSNHSVQYIQTYMYTLSKSMLEHMGDDYSLDDFKNSLDITFKNTFGDFIKNDATRNIKKLCYKEASSTGAIYAILSLFEYEAQKLTGVKRDNLYKLIQKDKIEFDHIMPKSLRNDGNEDVIDSIGNLTFLEKPLNSSKNDTQEVASVRYSDSSFITTKLIIDGNRYESLSNDNISDVTTNILPYHTDDKTINNFSVENITDRRNRIAEKVREYLQISD